MDTQSDEIERAFPELLKAGYWCRSEATPAYNCIAFAAGETDGFWCNTRLPYTYWPDGVPDDGKVASLAELFEGLGYERCKDGTKEAGVEKVALYAEDDQWTHAARQTDDGTWVSKLGKGADIEHCTVEGLHGARYGTVALFMQRRRKGGGARGVTVALLQLWSTIRERIGELVSWTRIGQQRR